MSFWKKAGRFFYRVLIHILRGIKIKAGAYKKPRIKKPPRKLGLHPFNPGELVAIVSVPRRDSVKYIGKKGSVQSIDEDGCVLVDTEIGQCLVWPENITLQ
jgi:hypothetical protein